jgi:hypothetical protein
VRYVAVQLVGGASRGKLRHALSADLVQAAARARCSTVCGRPARLVDGPDFEKPWDEVDGRDQCGRCRAEIALRLIEESGEIDTTAPPAGMFP